MNPFAKALLVVGIVVVAVLVTYILLKQRTGSPRLNTMPTESNPQSASNHSGGAKQHLNVAVLGVPSFPGVELSSAMLRVASQVGSADLSSLEKLKSQESKDAAIAPFTYLEYESKAKHYAHMLLCNSVATPSQLVLGLRMADAAILVIGSEGFTPELRRHILLAEVAGVQKVIVFVEGGENSLPVANRNLESLLAGTGYKPQDVPVIVGKMSPDTNGAVAELLTTMDRLVNRRQTASKRPFLLPIDDIFSIQGKGIVVTGMVERGSLRVGETVELVGFGRRLPTTCLGIEIFKGTLTVAQAGDCVGILLKGIERDQVSSGMVLATTRSVDLASRFRGSLRPLSKDNSPPTGTQDVELLIRTATVQAKATALPVRENRANGQASTEFMLSHPMPLEKGVRFAVVVGGQLVAVGSVEDFFAVMGEGTK